MRKITTTTLVATGAALTLTGCSVFGPSLEDRAVTAAETIMVAVDAENAATAQIEADRAAVQAQIDDVAAKPEALYEASEVVSEEVDNASLDDYDAAWAEYEAAWDAYEAAQAKAETDLEPLYKEQERLDALYTESLDSPLMAMGFSLMATCPELAPTGDESMLDNIDQVDVTESCVESLELWAGKLS